MKAAHAPVSLRVVKSDLLSKLKATRTFKAAALIVIVGLIATTLYLPSSASSLSPFAGAAIGVGGLSAARDLGIPDLSMSEAGSFNALMALQSPETISVSPPATRAPGCNDPNVLCLGETATAVVTDAPLREGFRERRIQWVAPDGTVPQMVDVDENPETDTYALPTTGSFAQVGKWMVRTITNRGGGMAVATFEVGDPTQPSADIEVTMTGPASVTANTNISYDVSVTNLGPDAASGITLVNPVPYSTNFVAAVPAEDFTCVTPSPGDSGIVTCSGASLAANTTVVFTFTFSVNSDVTNGTAVYNLAKGSSLTNDPNSANNYGDIYSKSTAPTGGGTCTLDCPTSLNAIANTTVNGERGAHVSFDDTIPDGDCGTITTTPSSGSFFPVGTTTVTSTSSVGGASCTFTVTVEDQDADPPTVNCPANKQANADANCAANVLVGTATATGANVTVFGVRSDGRPMYDCDVNGTNCTRKATDEPFSAGITTISWTAYAHDVAGPYANFEDEEAHRTGNASCTQTVTVDDVTAPSITAPADQAAAADSTCNFTMPDYTTSASVSDNCACASSDESEICQGRQPLTISQSPAPGTVVGLGPHTITLTANDGSSNNNGAGNTATAQFTVTVSDTTPPSLTAPADSSANANASCQAPVPDYAAASNASDNCDASITVTQSPTAGTLVGPGSHVVTVTATDDAGLMSTDTVVFTVVDNTAPTISCPANIIVYLPLNSPATSTVVNYTAPTGTDNCSGATTAQTAGLGSGASFPVGTTTNTFTVTDGAGLTASCSFTVTVRYNFTGFFSPVSNPPALNSVNAGRSIPLKFSLSGNKGLGIFAADSPSSQQVTCDTSAPLSELEGTETPGGSTLTYSPDQYHYNWKTESAWAGTCRQLVVTLNDGTTHIALFKFK